MGTSRQQIEQWFQEGVAQKATHMIVVCDTYDWEDYPVYVKSTEDVRSRYDAYNGQNMQKVMEVYKLTEPMIPQVTLPRCFNF